MHYKEMCKRYHMLSGIDDPNMKHAFITSFPEEILAETFRLMKVKSKPVFMASLGKIFQHVLEKVEKFCS